MNDLISRNALIAEYDRVHIGPPGGARKLMEDAPTVDAVPVVHGEWKVLECDGGEPGGYAPYIDVECSNCGLTVGIEQGQYDWAYGDPFPWKCCPFCEAKMDGGNEDE